MEGTNVIGYFINSDPQDEKVISCSTEVNGDYDCDIIFDEDNTECEEAGDVIIQGEGVDRKAYLCTSDSTTLTDHIEIQANTVVETKYVTLELDADPLFPGESESGSICVKVSGEGSVTKVNQSLCRGESVKECEVATGANCVVGNYYLVDTETNTLLSGSGVEGSLYHCEEEKKACTQIIKTGYYVVDEETLYSCQDSTCQMAEYVDSCTDETTGRVRFHEDKFYICLVDTVGVELTVANNGDYIVQASTGNIFASTNYALINIKEHVVTLNNDYKNDLKYVYVNKSTAGNYKVMKKGDTCPKTANELADIMEFKCSNSQCQLKRQI